MIRPGAGETNPELALQHRGGTELAPHHQLRGLGQQIVVVITTRRTPAPPPPPMLVPAPPPSSLDALDVVGIVEVGGLAFPRTRR
jgi:hypothetical protein